MRIVERATRRRYTPPVPACRRSVKNRAIQNAGRLYSLAETQGEVLDRINRIDRIDGSGDSNALQSNLDTPTHENPVVPRVGEPIFFCRERRTDELEVLQRLCTVTDCISRGYSVGLYCAAVGWGG